MKKILLFIVFISQFTFSQEERKTLFGIIYNENGVLENAHIVNLTTHQATFSNKKGEYRIFAKPNDSIRFSSIGYKTIFEKLIPNDFNVYRKRTTLEKRIYELDEVSLKNNELSGSLSNDLKKVKHNPKLELAKKASNFSEIKYTSNSGDHINTSVKPNVVRTDPTTAFEGLGTTTVIPFKQVGEVKKLRKELAFKESLPAKLLNELGEDFFFIELKIPVDKYYHFLEYCSPLSIENFYKKNEVLKVINTLRKEHLNYLKLIEKH